MRKAKYLLISLCLLFILTACGDNKIVVNNISFICPENYVLEEVNSTDEDIKTYNLLENGVVKCLISHTTNRNTAIVMMGSATVYDDTIYMNVDDMACAEYEDKNACWHAVIYEKVDDENYDLYRFDFNEDIDLVTVNSIICTIEYKR